MPFTPLRREDDGSRDLLTVWHHNRGLLVLPEVADALGLVQGQEIDEPTFWRTIDLNTAALRARDERSPSPNPALRAALAQCSDLTEQVVSRYHASRGERQ